MVKWILQHSRFLRKQRGFGVVSLDPKTVTAAYDMEHSLHRRSSLYVNYNGSPLAPVLSYGQCSNLLSSLGTAAKYGRERTIQWNSNKPALLRHWQRVNRWPWAASVTEPMALMLAFCIFTVVIRQIYAHYDFGIVHIFPQRCGLLRSSYCKIHGVGRVVRIFNIPRATEFGRFSTCDS